MLRHPSVSEATDWEAIVRLYDGLVELWPSPSARLARLVARGHSPAVGASSARLELDADEELFAGATAAQAYAVRAELGILCGDDSSVLDDLRASAARSTDRAVLRYLGRRIAGLGG